MKYLKGPFILFAVLTLTACAKSINTPERNPPKSLIVDCVPLPPLAPKSPDGATGAELMNHITAISRRYMDCWSRYEKLIDWAAGPG